MRGAFYAAGEEMIFCPQTCDFDPIYQGSARWLGYLELNRPFVFCCRIVVCVAMGRMSHVARGRWRADCFDAQAAASRQAKWQHEVPHRAISGRSRTTRGATGPRPERTVAIFHNGYWHGELEGLLPRFIAVTIDPTGHSSSATTNTRQSGSLHH